MRFLTTTILFLTLTGCEMFHKGFPTESDIAGTWEGTGIMPYVRLQYEIGKPSYLVVVNSEDSYELYQIKKFISNEEDFLLELKSSDSEEIETMYGRLIMGQIELRESRGDDLVIFWLTEKAKLHNAKKIADQAIGNQ